VRFRNPDRWFRQLDIDPMDWIPSQQSSNQDILPSLAIFSAGLLVGVGTALMLAPKPGPELRRDVARSVNKLGHDIRETVPLLPDPPGSTDATSDTDGVATTN